MNWTIWRLHRNQAIFASGALAAMTAFLVVTGIHLASVYHQALATCAATDSCSSLDQYFQGDGWLWMLSNLTILIPALFGLFWGAPLVAREIEDATHKLAWTQSVPRRRWLSTNLAWVLLAAAVWGAAMAALMTWWKGTENAVQLNRFNQGQFDIQGIVPAAYSVFAVALGIAAGAWLRRVLPAAAATVGGFVLVRVVVELFVRAHYLAPATFSMPLGEGAGRRWLGAAWLLTKQIVDRAGHAVGLAGDGRLGVFSSDMPAACRSTLALADPRSMLSCLGQQGFHVVVSYQPASRFWTFQGIESGIFLALAAILVALASWRVLTADA